MNRPLICLTLTSKTINENLSIVEKYRQYVDIVELRADYLEEDECLHIRRFPMLAKIPCILTIRRRVDGGLFDSGEASRSMLFARALAFAESDTTKNFQYVDFEDDFHVPSLQDAALAFGTKIIRSYHNMTDPVYDIIKKCDDMRKTRFEIPKIAFMPHSLKDVTYLFRETKYFTKYEHILCAMGPLGTPSRILAYKTNSYLTYVSPEETSANTSSIGHISPIELNEIYHFKTLNDDTKIYGITGWPLAKTSSPELHNSGYKAHNMNAVYIPFRTPNFQDAIEFADEIGVRGFSVTIPHKEAAVPYMAEIDNVVESIGACNTVVKNRDGSWSGYNTDAPGLTKAILEFLKLQNLRWKKVAIIGAGGAARAIAYAVKKLGGKACVFNRTIGKAKVIADMFNFEYMPLSLEALDKLERYSDIIIQTTSVGMGSSEPSNENNDPLYFYQFKGNESVYDIVYVPECTPMMQRAKDAGCRVCNGYSMLKYQGMDQFKLFTGEDYEITQSE